MTARQLAIEGYRMYKTDHKVTDTRRKYFYKVFGLEIGYCSELKVTIVRDAKSSNRLQNSKQRSLQ